MLEVLSVKNTIRITFNGQVSFTYKCLCGLHMFCITPRIIAKVCDKCRNRNGFDHIHITGQCHGSVVRACACPMVATETCMSGGL